MSLVDIILEHDDFYISDLADMVQECNGWDGSLGDYYYYENDEDFFKMFFTNGYEVARAITYGEYHYMDVYVRLNGYGNLESKSSWERDRELEDGDKEIVETFLELYMEGNVDASFLEFDLDELIEEYEEE